MIDISSIKTIIENKCKSLKIVDYDFTYREHKTHLAKSRNGLCEEGKVEHQQRGTLRCWTSENGFGFVEFDLSSPDEIPKALEAACVSSAYRSSAVLPQLAPQTAPLVGIQEEALAEETPLIEIGQKIVALEKEILSWGYPVVGVPYNTLKEVFSKKIYFNSQGAYREDMYRYASLLLSCTVSHRSKTLQGFCDVYVEGPSIRDLPSELSLKLLKIKSHAEHNGIHITNSNIKFIIFSPYAFLQIFYGFENLFNGQKVLDSQSLSKKHDIGKRISSQILTIKCEPFHKNYLRKKRFDGEGTSTNITPIITQGVLESFLHSHQTARHFGVASTGHAVMGAKITVAPHFLTIAAGKKHPIQNEHGSVEGSHLPEGDFVYIEELFSLHAGLHPQQGSFSLPFKGWSMKDGAQCGITNATVAGDIFAMLDKICDLSNHPQTTPLGMSPEVWVSGLTITSVN